MYCPRLDHFVRFNPNGTVSPCGHMVNPAQFDSFESMRNSVWLQEKKNQLAQDVWPSECVRCREIESQGLDSIRTHALALHELETDPEYLQVGGVLDNICNAGCLTCNPECSTKIGSLHGRTFPIVDNSKRFWNLPLQHIRYLDINGGEPSYSKNYKNILTNLPKNIKRVRINTNCSTVIPEIATLLDQGVEVIVTVSLDGIESVHDYVRWPIKWDKFYKNLMTYKSMNLTELNTWTTVSALNIANLQTIFDFVRDNNLLHSWAFLDQPDPLNVKYKNNLTQPYNHVFPHKVAVDRDNQLELDHYLDQQHKLRGLL